MENVTTDQVTSLVSSLSKLVGAVLVTLGLTTPESWETLSNGALQIAGGFLIVVPLIIDMFKNSRLGIIKSAAKLPEVKEVVATPKFADAIPMDKVRSERGR